MAIFAVLSAIAGAALTIGGRIAAHARQRAAAEEAIALGAKRMHEGKTLTDQNASQLAQDNAAILSLSGVSSSEGTAAELHKQVMLTKDATINKIEDDYEAWKSQVRSGVQTDLLNTSLSVAGDLFSLGGKIALRTQSNRLNSFTIPEPIGTSPAKPTRATSGPFSLETN